MKSGVIDFNYWYRVDDGITFAFDLRQNRFITVTGDDPHGAVKAVRELRSEAERKVQTSTRSALSRLKISSSGACGRDCTYCFGGDRRSEPVPWEVARLAIETLVETLGPDAPYYEIYYDTGSQPLEHHEGLACLLETGAELEAQTGKRIVWRVATNGGETARAGETLARIRDVGGSVVLRIDGPRDIHNRARVHRNGHVPHEQALETFDLARKLSVPVEGEAIITGDYPYPARVFTYLRDLGFSRIATRPVRSNRVYDLQVARFRTGYEDLFSVLQHSVRSGQEDVFRQLANDQALSPLWRLLPGLENQTRQQSEIVVDAKGFFHVCDRLVGSQSRVVGSMQDGINWNSVDQDPEVIPRSPCTHCWARFACGGACRLTGIYKNLAPQSIDRLPCEFNEFLVQKNLELIAYAAAPVNRLELIRKGLLATVPESGSTGDVAQATAIDPIKARGG